MSYALTRSEAPTQGTPTELSDGWPALAPATAVSRVSESSYCFKMRTLYGAATK